MAKITSFTIDCAKLDVRGDDKEVLFTGEKYDITGMLASQIGVSDEQLFMQPRLCLDFTIMHENGVDKYFTEDQITDLECINDGGLAYAHMSLTERLDALVVYMKELGYETTIINRDQLPA